MSKLIYLTGKHGSIIGNYAVVDDEDYDKVIEYTWHCYINKNKTQTLYYAANQNKESLHKFVLKINNFDSFELVDHWDGNGLNNQKINLRPCNKSQNAINRSKHKNSLYKGVTKHHSGYWTAKIKYMYKTCSLGHYDTPEKAAEAYDKKAIELFGEFARLNFPEKDYSKINPCPRKKLSNSGYKNIRYLKKSNTYRVSIVSNKIRKIKHTKTLEEAIKILEQFKKENENNRSIG